MNVIIDYGMGNIGSIQNMLKRIGQKSVISNEPEIIEQAERLILPGVGSFDTGMKKLDNLRLINILNQKALTDKIPILGICLGLQLMTKKSMEGQLSGLHWFDATTEHFSFEHIDKKLVLPNMGWRKVNIIKDIPLFHGMKNDIWFYFVHNYHVVANNLSNIAVTSNYGYDFVASLVKDNIIGLQFHPEKSHQYGIKLFSNFFENY